MKAKKRAHTITQTRNYLGGISSVKLFFVSTALLLLSMLLLILALLVQRPTVKPLVVPATGIDINTPVSMGLVSMKITNVSFSDGQPGFKAPENMHYAVIDISVENLVDRPLDILPSSDTYLKDDTGAVSYLTPFALARPFRAGRLLPGEVITGQLSYIVSKSAAAKLYVDSIWSGGVVPFKVQ